MRKSILALATLLLMLCSNTQVALGQYTVLHSFSRDDNGGTEPLCNLVVVGSTLYGTASGSNVLTTGTLYKLNTDGSQFQVLHQFEQTTGTQPTGGLALVDSTLFGTTSHGGSYNAGNVYAMNTDGSGYHEVFPLVDQQSGTGLTASGTTVFGTQFLSTGLVFRFDSDGSGYQQFPVSPQPYSPVTISGTTLYGTTFPSPSASILFQMSIDGTSQQVLHTFAGGPNDGSNPYFAQLLQVGSTLIGTTANGGTNDRGTIYQINTDGTNFHLLHSFKGTATDGAKPFSGLIQVGSRLYGMTPYGGPGGLGTIYEINLDGTGYRLLHTFNGSDGANPAGGLTLSGNTLYGVTAFGGPSNDGVIFALQVPEPSTGVLLLTGVALLCCRRRLTKWSRQR